MSCRLWWRSSHSHCFIWGAPFLSLCFLSVDVSSGVLTLLLWFSQQNIPALIVSTPASPMILPGYQTSDSASSSKYHHLSLLVALVSHCSNFHHWPLLALLYGTSVALGWLSGFKFCHPIVKSLIQGEQHWTASLRSGALHVRDDCDASLLWS